MAAEKIGNFKGNSSAKTWLFSILNHKIIDHYRKKINLPVFAGWALHFMIGIIFALSYVFLFVPVLIKINSRVFKGIIFGITVFVFAQIMMAVMSKLSGSLASPGGSILLAMAGGLMGHVIYGIVVALFVKTAK